jgi:2'-5' RNA ligase
MLKAMKLLAVLGICLASLPGWAKTARGKPKAVTAINIALDPDAALMQNVKAVNARLLRDTPEGFAFDATHKPHITLLQRYVLTEHLDGLYAAVDRILANRKGIDLKLQASRYDYTIWKNKGIGILVVEPTPALRALQQQLIEAVAPFTVKTGTTAAFFITPDDPHINPTTVDYVETFMPKHTGDNYHPHVTLGMASPDYLKKIIAEPFKAFTFSPAGVSVYQLGNFGTARKQLKTWPWEL